MDKDSTDKILTRAGYKCEDCGHTFQEKKRFSRHTRQKRCLNRSDTAGPPSVPHPYSPGPAASEVPEYHPTPGLTAQREEEKEKIERREEEVRLRR